MTRARSARTAPQCGQPPAGALPPPPAGRPGPGGALDRAGDGGPGDGGSGDGGRGGDLPEVRITVFCCRPDEAVLFQAMAPRLGVRPVLTEVALSSATVDLASGSHCVSVGHTTRVGRPALHALHGSGIRYLSTRSVGHDHIDLPCAEGLGITVGTVSYSPDSVADFTLMLMLMALRGAKSTLCRVQERDYRLGGTPGRELRDLTVGVVGTGRIGSAVIHRLHGFGTRVLAHDRRPTGTATYLPLDDLLRRSDVVTLHTPLTADTHHLLSRRRIERLRTGAIVVNTGRGPLVDSEALLRALESGHLGGAALDVVEGDEACFYADRRHGAAGRSWLSRLQELPNVVVTPHTAFYTEHALRDVVEHTLANCLRFEGRATWRG